MYSDGLVLLLTTTVESDWHVPSSDSEVSSFLLVFHTNYLTQFLKHCFKLDEKFMKCWGIKLFYTVLVRSTDKRAKSILDFLTNSVLFQFSSWKHKIIIY